jgi:hypothetical protein
MSELTPEEYDRQYNEALAKLDAAAAGEPEATPAPEPEPVTEQAPEPAKADEPPPVDPLEELRARLEKAEKIAADNKAWGTKQAQELAALKREREQQQREASKPAILDANPELADAIRYVASDPAPQQQVQHQQQQWQELVASAHPGIFDIGIDPELEQALLAKREALGESWYDPMVAIREITAEKLAHTERMIGKKFMAEAAKAAQKSAMSVPGAGASTAKAAPVDPQTEMANRYRTMSAAEFEKERRRVLGY